MLKKSEIALRLAYWIESIVVKETVPKKRGELARSIKAQSRGQGAIVGTKKVYAAMRHFGGVIRPKHKKALFWPGAKHPVKKVKQKGKPYFYEALALANSRFPKEAGRIFPDLGKKTKEMIAKRLEKIKGMIVVK
jgi:phage gpG-like protein